MTYAPCPTRGQPWVDAGDGGGALVWCGAANPVAAISARAATTTARRRRYGGTARLKTARGCPAVCRFPYAPDMRELLASGHARLARRGRALHGRRDP